MQLFRKHKQKTSANKVYFAIDSLIQKLEKKFKKMSTEYDRLMRQYNVPPGVLSEQQMRLLKQGGIRLDQSDQEFEDSYHAPNRHTRPKLPQFNAASAMEIESLKQIYQDKLSIKEKQINFLQHQLNSRDQLMDAERHRVHTEHQLEMEKILAELRNARAKVVHTEGQVPLIKEALNQVREMLSGMVSETVYLRLKDFNERELPPSEWILVNVWELIYPYKKELEYNKKEVSKLRQQIKIMNDKQHSLLNEIEHYSRLLSSKDDDGKRHALNYENSRKSMELEIEKLREELELIREKGSRYDELLRDYQFTKQQKQLIEEKLGFYNKQTSSNDTGNNPRLNQEEAQRRKIDLLAQDKEYLTKENIQLIEKNRRLQDRLDRLQQELLSEKNRSQEYLHQLLNLKTDSISGYEQKISRQLQELKDKHRHELEMAKNNLVDIYEKQVRFLKESIDEKEIKLQSVSRQLKQKTREYDQMMIDQRDFQRKFDGDLAETRIQLRIKSEELERVNCIYQQTLANLNVHKHENDMLREKLNVLKGEFYKAEANNKDEMSGLKATVAVLREQLANYEIIEKQMDEAIMAMGKINPNDNSIFANTLHSVPTANKRRIQQAMNLAQRLQAKQRQHEETLETLRKTKDELDATKDELKIARSLLDKTNQPYSYLVSNIEEKQKEVLLLRNENKKLDQNYENIKEEYRELKRQLEEAEKDVQRLLIKRQSIQNIQNILIELSRGPTTASQLNGAIDQIRDILGATGMRQTQKLSNTGEMKLGPTNDVPNWFKKLQDNKNKGK